MKEREKREGSSDAGAVRVDGTRIIESGHQRLLNVRFLPRHKVWLQPAARGGVRNDKEQHRSARMNMDKPGITSNDMEQPRKTMSFRTRLRSLALDITSWRVRNLPTNRP